mgnify:CR=1 FL=1
MKQTLCDGCGRTLPEDTDTVLDNNHLAHQSPQGSFCRWDFCDRCWRLVHWAIGELVDELRIKRRRESER